MRYTKGPGPSRRDRRKSERQAELAERDVQKEVEQFAASPVGQARAAKHAGDALFQVAMPVSQRKHLGGWSGIEPIVPVDGLSIESSASELAQIEAEGWSLDDVGYVYERTGQVSRNRLFSSGERTTTLGCIVGIYLFRRI